MVMRSVGWSLLRSGYERNPVLRTAGVFMISAPPSPAKKGGTEGHHYFGNFPSKGTKISPLSLEKTAIPSVTLIPKAKSPIFAYQFLITSAGLLELGDVLSAAGLQPVSQSKGSRIEAAMIVDDFVFIRLVMVWLR